MLFYALTLHVLMDSEHGCDADILIYQLIKQMQRYPRLSLCYIFENAVLVLISFYQDQLNGNSMLYCILKVETLEGEERYSRVIRQLLDDHQSVVTHLAEGFHECQKNVPVSHYYHH